ncbi:MAG: alpha-2-macroglobulin family protein [Pyrinomonadaceae bacterium]
MRNVLFAALVVCLIGVGYSNGQAFIEKGSSILIEEQSFDMNLRFRSDAKNSNRLSTFEVLNENDEVVGRASNSLVMKKGEHNYKITIPYLKPLDSKNSAFNWFRLRYNFGAKSDIIPFSSLIENDFELQGFGNKILAESALYRIKALVSKPENHVGVEGVDVVADLILKSEDDEDDLKISMKSKSDKEGFAVFEFNLPDEFTHYEDDAEFQLTGKNGGLVRTVGASLVLEKPEVEAIIQTDKAIYQPGQNLNIRFLAMKRSVNKRIIPSKDFTVKISDGDDNLLFKEQLKTTDFGVSFTTWKIPESVRTGNLNIEIFDQEDEAIAIKTIVIKPYDLPKFTVNAITLKPYYLINEPTAEVRVSANYLFGQPLNNGTVKISTEGKTSWNSEIADYVNTDAENTVKGRIDSNGVFIGNLNLSESINELANSKWRKFDDIPYIAYVTDSATNRTEQRRFYVRISKQPIHLRFIKDLESYTQGSTLQGFVTAFYADGTPAEASIAINVVGNYDNGTFIHENLKQEYETNDVIRFRTNQYGVARLKIRLPIDEDKPFDRAFLYFDAVDAQGKSGSLALDKNWNSVSINKSDSQIQFETNKAIFVRGEPIKLSITSNLGNSRAFIEINKSANSLSSTSVLLKNGVANIAIPTNDNFTGEIDITVYAPNEYGELTSVSHSIVFPNPSQLTVQAKFDRNSYKPAQTGTLSFIVKNEQNKGIESVMGVSIFDKAVEERARTDAEFSGAYFYSNLFNTRDSLGEVSELDLKNLDTTKPISDDLQLVAAALFYESGSQLESFESYDSNGAVLKKFIDKLSNFTHPFCVALEKHYQVTNGEHAQDEGELRRILAKYSLNFDAIHDQWNKPIYASFSVDDVYDVVAFRSSGPDKIRDTNDDFTISSSRFNYFAQIGKRIDEATKSFNGRTEDFIRNKNTLLSELGESELIDRFGNPYYFEFSTINRNATITVKSSGPDGIRSKNNLGDDFTVWTNSTDFFEPTDSRLRAAINNVDFVPMTVPEFNQFLSSANLDPIAKLAKIGIKAHIESTIYSEFADKRTNIRTKVYGSEKWTNKVVVTPVTLKIIEFTIVSEGDDETPNSYDDVVLGSYSFIISEQKRDDASPEISFQKTRFGSNGGTSGKIVVTVKDSTGSAIPDAEVSLTESNIGFKESKTTNQNGIAEFRSLKSGTYSAEGIAPGFQKSRITGIRVQNGEVKRIRLDLEVSEVDATVDVTYSGYGSGNGTGDSSASNSITTVERNALLKLPNGAYIGSKMNLAGIESEDQPEIIEINGKKFFADESGTLRSLSELSTPKLRSYFPETLVWAPNLKTDSTGKASLDFKMADNLTTWKMVALVSTKDGKVSVTENEVQSFQPFFVELDPPKFLTQGDEIYLPSQIRNYTKSPQKVSVTFAREDWLSFLDPQNRTKTDDSKDQKANFTLPAGETKNAVFGFRAERFIKAGKQKLTAIGTTESDAVEKSVAVKPNGHFVSQSTTKIERGNLSIPANIPAQSIPNTIEAEIKIYPNLFAHITESVEGLLQRPYGCGEQTISSTYPNLLILKYTKPENSIRKTALKFLIDGYEKLLSYQTPNGGFSYWGGKNASPDIALTAYAIRFLRDASVQIEVDEAVIKRAESWLWSTRLNDGSWNVRYSWEKDEYTKRKIMLTTLVAKTLSQTDAQISEKLKKTVEFLSEANSKIDEPYSLALLGQIGIQTGNEKLASEIAQKLRQLAYSEGDGKYWNLETNTPFYGWGRVGRLETTALVVQFLSQFGAREKLSNGGELLDGALTFLMKNKDQYGVWYSTQATVNVLDALVSEIGSNPMSEKGLRTVTIIVDGKQIKSVSLPNSKSVVPPVAVNISEFVSNSTSKVEVQSNDDEMMMTQLVTSYYTGWENAETSNVNINASRQLAFDYGCDKYDARIMDEISCGVKAERIGYKGYGMLLAEIGIPPGAEVDRESLEAAKRTNSISRYDILPDRIIVYLWAIPGGSNFQFKFKPRYGINAQTPESFIYDYYNEDAKAVVRPLKFVVK